MLKEGNGLNTDGSGQGLQRSAAGVSDLQPRTGTSLWPVKKWATQQEGSLNVMCLNHPGHPPSRQFFMGEKLSPMKLAHGGKKVGEC